ncbi:MAG: hypothetical protein AB1758_02655 [Candidatus Eremiobacterota bacterium]
MDRVSLEFRQAAFLGLGWKQASPEEASERVHQGKEVEVRPDGGRWVPLQGPEDLRELAYFQGENSTAPAELAGWLRGLAQAGVRFHAGGEVGPFGAYNQLTGQLDLGEPLTARAGEREVPLGSLEDVRLLAFFHDLCPAPSERARSLKALYRAGGEWNQGEVYRDGVLLLSLEPRELDRPEAVEKAVQEATERWDRLRDLGDLAPAAYALLMDAPPEREALLLPLCRAAQDVPAQLYEHLAREGVPARDGVEALRARQGDDAAALEFLRRCRADGVPVSAAAEGLTGVFGADRYPTLARLSPGALENLEALARLRDPAWEAQGTWDRESGSVWSDSPGKPYRDGEDSSLTSPPIDLTGVKGARLDLTARFDLEAGCDVVSLEVRPEGGDWEALARYTGTQSDWRSQTLDLSACDGKTVRLRFRLKTDSSQVREGFSFKELRVGSPQGVVFSTDLGSEPFEKLLEHADEARLLEDATRLGSARAALALLGQPAPVAELAARIGLTPALALKAGPEAAPLVELARELDPGGSESLRLELAARLLHRPPDAAEQAALRQLAGGLSSPAGWTAEKTWAVVEQDGRRVWTDSPGGQYPDQQDSSLVTPELRLGRDGRLAFQLKTDLENGCDFLHVEVLSGGKWASLERHTGTREWIDRELDLSPWAGQAVKVRFRLTSDSSNRRDGVSLSDLRVKSEGRSLLAFDEGAGTRADLAALATAEDRSRRLTRVVELARETGSTAAALALEPSRGTPSALGELARKVGVRQAVALAGVADASTPSLWEAAGRLQDSFRIPTDFASRTELVGTLAKARVTPEQVDRLSYQPPAPGWEAGPGWAEAVEPEGRLWQMRYRDKQDSSLISPELDLTHVRGARLMFDHRYELEAGCDFVRLEAQPVGGQWSELARYTGSGSWRDQVVDLSRYDGQKVRIRFRLTSDNSNVREGYRLGSVLVGGSRPVFADLRPPVRLDQAVATLADTPPDRRDAVLEVLKDTAQALRSRDAALSLLPCLDKVPPERLRKLTEALGPELAARLGPAAQDPDRLLECFGVAVQLASAQSQPLGREELATHAAALCQAGLTAEEVAAMQGLAARRAPEFPHGDGWAPVRNADGLHWALSPYRDNADTSLELPRVDLTGMSGARLQLDGRHELENGCDFLRVEARRPGERWQELDRWTGSGDWSERDLDLSALDGGPVELRFRLTSDSSNTREGVRLRGLRLRARADGEERPRTLVAMAEGRSSASDLMCLVASTPAGPPRAFMLDSLRYLTERLDSASAALDLWPVVKDPTAVKVEALADLAASLGVERARHLWPLAEEQADPKRAVTRLVNLYEASWTLSRSLALRPTEEERLALVGELASTDAEGEDLNRLARLCRTTEAIPGELKPQEPWGIQPDPKGGLLWADSPKGTYEDHQDTSLELGPVALGGLQGCLLTFDMTHSLENNCDFLRVESLRGGKWAELARFTGESGQATHELALDGPQAHLRFRLTSDSSTVRDGVKLGRILVGGYEPSGEFRCAFQHDPRPVRWGALTELLKAPDRADRLAMVERLSESVRLPGALEAAAAARDGADADRLLDLYRLLGQWGEAPTPDSESAVLRALAAEADPAALLHALRALPPRDAWRVVSFILTKQDQGPLAQRTLLQALEGFFQVAGYQVLVEDLDRVLEMMLQQSASTIGEQGDKVLVGGVAVRKKA